MRAKNLSAAALQRRADALLLLSQGLTQQEVADKLGYHVRTVRRLGERLRAGEELLPAGPLLDALQALYEAERFSRARVGILRLLVQVTVEQSRLLRAHLRRTGPVFRWPAAEAGADVQPTFESRLDPEQLQKAARWGLHLIGDGGAPPQ